MAATAPIENRKKTIAFSGLDIVITGTSSNHSATNTPQYYSLCNVKSIESKYHPNPNNYPYDVMAQIIIHYVDTQGQNAKLDFDIQDVTNQPTWSTVTPPTKALLETAAADIKTAKDTACAGASTATTDALLTSILATLGAMKENEFVKVKDANGDIFALKAETDQDSGTVTYSYINADGTAAVPVAPVTFIIATGIQESQSASTETGAGAIPAGKKSVVVFNQGGAAGTFLGQPLAAGLSVPIAAQPGNTLGAMAFDATGTSFLIIISE